MKKKKKKKTAAVMRMYRVAFVGEYPMWSVVTGSKKAAVKRVSEQYGLKVRELVAR